MSVFNFIIYALNQLREMYILFKLISFDDNVLVNKTLKKFINL